ncbi:exo-alpha-sialidase [Trypanosoma cruzi]|nr:exo-alpha-sialidase [Trypanosoma cruzi]
MYPATISEESSQPDLWVSLYLVRPSATAIITPPARTRDGKMNADFTPLAQPFFSATCVLFGKKISTHCGSCTSPDLLPTAVAAPLPQHIIATSRSSTGEVNTRRDMLGLRGSLSPPSAGSGHAATVVCAECLHCSNT